MSMQAATKNDIDDLASAIQDLATMMGEGFERLGAQQTETNQRLTNLETAQAETNRHLTSIDGRLETIENDIKELYEMVAGLQKTAGRLQGVDDLLQKQIDEVVRFAETVAERTGVPFKHLK